MTAGTITHEKLSDDVAVIYAWGVTPEGDEYTLTMTENGEWRDEAGRTFISPVDAYATAAEALA